MSCVSPLGSARARGLVGRIKKKTRNVNAKEEMKKSFCSRKMTLTMKSILLSLAALTFTSVKAEEGNSFYECLPGLPLSGGGEFNFY